MYTKKLWLITLMLLMVLSFVIGCGRTDEPAPDTEMEEPPVTEPENGEEAAPDTEPEDPADQEEAGDQTALVDQGEEVVQQACLTCHGGDLQGDMGPSLYNVSERYTDEELLDILVNGQGNMPGGTANGEEEAVIAYLKTLEE